LQSGFFKSSFVPYALSCRIGDIFKIVTSFGAKVKDGRTPKLAFWNIIFPNILSFFEKYVTIKEEICTLCRNTYSKFTSRHALLYGAQK
jgi:hypothetical protein